MAEPSSKVGLLTGRRGQKRQRLFSSRLKMALARRAVGLLPANSFFELRRNLYALAGLDLGRNVRIVGDCCLLDAGISIGDDSSLDSSVLLSGGGQSKILIGRGVVIGPRCSIITGTHEVGGPDRRCGANCYRDVVIGDGTWLRANVTVISGVTIGPGCIVEPGSIVANDLPPNVVAAGNPARVIDKLPPDRE